MMQSGLTESALCPYCGALVTCGECLCQSCGKSLPYADMDDGLIRGEREALYRLMEDVSISLRCPPKPLKYLAFPSIPDCVAFYHVPETGHFYAALETKLGRDLGRSWDAIEKSEIMHIVRTLCKSEECLSAGSMAEDDSPSWRPKLHDLSLTDTVLASWHETDNVPLSDEAASAMEAETVKAFKQIDWERGGHKQKIPGAIKIWDKFYYIPAAQRFYYVASDGDYYHGYESDVRLEYKEMLLARLLVRCTGMEYYWDVGVALRQTLNICALYNLISRLPERSFEPAERDNKE
jgi:hypothetical protein